MYGYAQNVHRKLQQLVISIQKHPGNGSIAGNRSHFDPFARSELF